jgi:hypothetical protein
MVNPALDPTVRQFFSGLNIARQKINQQCLLTNHQNIDRRCLLFDRQNIDRRCLLFDRQDLVDPSTYRHVRCVLLLPTMPIQAPPSSKILSDKCIGKVHRSFLIGSFSASTRDNFANIRHANFVSHFVNRANKHYHAYVAHCLQTTIFWCALHIQANSK